MRGLGALGGLLLLLLGGAAAAQTYDTMASEPNPRDFAKRAGTGLTLNGDPLRIAGMNLGWAALRSDTGSPDSERYPTAFEIGDGLATVQAMGGSAIRVLSAGSSAGCKLCLAPKLGQMNPAALRAVDLLLSKARDAGIKVIIPLSGSGEGCDGPGSPDPVAGTPCTYARWRGKAESAFFTDPQVEADFQRRVLAILNHVNSLTGVAYRNDPTILAWENCDGCGQGIELPALAAWTAQLGRAIKAADAHHLYENGAFAGRIGPGAGHATAAMLGLPSVDLLGDRVGASTGAARVAPGAIGEASDAVAAAGRAYLIDAYGWSPSDWPQASDLEGFLADIVADTGISGALTTDLEAHAEQGGFLPGAKWAGAPPPLYFPGVATPAADAAAMQARARIIRRFSYRLIGLTVPAFATVDPPQIIDAKGGHLRWRGAAGAVDYSIERTSDPRASGSWKKICERCVTDADSPWQDPAVPAGPAWYRMTPFNANLHAGLPSEPAPDR